jgi:hypothetical protein
MENVGPIADRLLKILTLAAVGAAAIGALRLIKVTGQQVQQTLEARYDQYRPLLVPDGKSFELIIGQSNDLEGRGYVFVELSGCQYGIYLHNIGSGPALGVWGVIYRPPPVSGDRPNHHFFKYGTPILAGQTEESASAEGTVILSGDVTIDKEGKHTLYAPPLPSLGEVLTGSAPTTLARLTITYKDIFNRKHASIFDFGLDKEWRAVDGGFFPTFRRRSRNSTARSRRGEGRLSPPFGSSSLRGASRSTGRLKNAN